MQRIIGPMRKAIEHYAMIEEGDKIAVGLSGGKDSITLLKGLKAIQRFYPLVSILVLTLLTLLF